MATATDFYGKANVALNTSGKEMIAAAQELYRKLHAGFIGSGVTRIPIAGDTTKLHLAAGLTPLQKKLARTASFLAQNMQGSQQLRRLMGHSQWGARVVYGDCVFITISPNEQHSALVLRLSRYRRNDPYIRHGDNERRRCCAADYPPLEMQSKNDDDAYVDLPAYDLRRAYTARDPHAVIEGYKLEILLRLGTLLGVRMCPDCPRCNNTKFGCQDKFGSNMRPCGGVLGGAVAFGGATEHQG